MDSSPAKQASEPSLPSSSNISALKRPAASLLPAFEPLSSSPLLPRPLKRQAREGANAYTKYPTPIPTSTTGILLSSPPRVGPRLNLQRTQSVVSERTPLCVVPRVELNENGDTLLMGRSSYSSHYQLSANRLISRVHVKARYIASPDPLEQNKVEIICNGWNGIKLHCQGRTWELGKGDTFTSETENAEIMLDVQDARVRIQWPTKKDRIESLANLSDSSWDDSPRSKTRGVVGATSSLQSSPLRRATRIRSPESPTPATHSASSANLQALLADDHEDTGPQIQIYEDASSDEQELPAQPAAPDPGASFATEVTNSFSSDLSEPQSEDDPENDPNEENDPIVHSFGPFGANLNNRLASFSTRSPPLRSPLGCVIGTPLSRTSASGDSAAVATATGILSSILAGSPSASPQVKSSPKATVTVATSPAATATATATAAVGLGISTKVDVQTIRNHLINQLAFSRLSSSPLSAIMNNLPAEEKKDLTRDELRFIIEGTTCVGIIPRQGKDAAGKVLESEYYYVSEADVDEARRNAVVDGLRRPSLRNCRKQHKQYYWKRPRTP